jgi:subtilisin family serine protease
LSLRLEGRFLAVVLLACLFPWICAGQQSTPPSSSSETTQSPPQVPSAPPHESSEQKQANAAGSVPASKQQPKRILGVMPNYRAVSAGAIPPPPTPKQSFIMASQNSFDYSAFIFVGVTSMLAEGTDSHPDLGKGVAGFGRYYWRGFLDKTGGNYLVMFAFPVVLHEDERYYAMGEGNFFKRGIYAASRILITPDYHGHNTFNASEILGRAASQGISSAYYPAADRTAGALAVKFGWAMGRDALTNVFREYWPDIATHVLHRHP